MLSSKLFKRSSVLVVMVFALALLFTGCDMVGPEVLEDSSYEAEEESIEVEAEALNDVRVEDDMYNVLIGFTHSPGESERDLIGNMGGEVKRAFNIVDAMEVNIPEKAIEALENSEIITYIEPNEEVEAHQTVPWGIDRVFGDEEYEFDTWAETKGANVGVAVLDTGIDDGHESLPDPVDGTNTVDDTHWGDDGNGHGTHVAGTVAALNNDIGVVGVGPEIDLYAVKVLDDDGGGSWASVTEGIEWAVENEVPILNMSLGGGDSETLGDAVSAAHEAGHLLVASAGNDGNPGGRGDNVGYPAAYDEVVAIAASDNNDNRARFSSTGPQVELIAPGQDVLSTVPGDEYEEYSGTSMSAPHVAGIAALVWDAENASLGDNEMIRGILQETAEDLGLDDEHQGYGLARADKAVAFDDGEDEDEEDEIVDPVVETKEAANITETSANLKGKLTDLGGADSVDVWFKWADNQDLNDSQETDRQALADTAEFEATIDELEPETTYYFKALAENDAGTDDGVIKEFTTLDTDDDEEDDDDEDLAEPEIEEFDVNTRSSGPWNRADVEWTVSHSDGALYEVKSELLDDGEPVDTETTSVSGEEASGEHSLRTRGNADSVRLIVTDTEGNKTTETKSVEF